MFDPELFEIVSADDVAKRKFICRQEFKYFFVYYMSEYVKFPFAAFHFEIFDALQQLNTFDIEELSKQLDRLRELGLIAFRESAKTSIIKGFVLWAICFKHYPYIIIDSYEKSNSENFLFDIIVQLQTNKKIVHDFGELFTVTDKTEFKETTKKRVSDFVTNHGIKVEAASTQESLRGRLFKNNRISLIIADDFENNKTKDSERVTQKIIEHFQEALAGMDAGGAIIYLGNYITEKGSVQWLMNRGKTDSKVKVMNIPLMTTDADGNKVLNWEDKYCFSKEEAKETGKVSIEELEEKLSPSVFQVEMMNNPYSAGMGIFKKEWFQYRDLDYIKNFCKRCYITIDTATGTGKDYNAIIVNYIDHTNAWHVMAYRNKDNASELVNNLFGLYTQYNPISIGIEKTTYTMGFMTFLQEQMRKRGMFLPIVELKHGGKKKEERIKNTLETRYANKSIYHVKGFSNELEDELLKFPLGLHDDLIDSLSYQSQIAETPMNVKINFSNTYKF